MYPDRVFVHLEIKDPILNTLYKIDSLNMTAPYIFHNQRLTEFLGLRNDKGNLVMILNNNNDISEYWEWLDKGDADMHRATESLHIGINDVMYAMTYIDGRVKYSQKDCEKGSWSCWFLWAL